MKTENKLIIKLISLPCIFIGLSYIIGNIVNNQSYSLTKIYEIILLGFIVLSSLIISILLLVCLFLSIKLIMDF